MFCSQCGKEIADNSKFCPECGKAIEAIDYDSIDKAKKRMIWQIGDAINMINAVDYSPFNKYKTALTKIY